MSINLKLHYLQGLFFFFSCHKSSLVCIHELCNVIFTNVFTKLSLSCSWMGRELSDADMDKKSNGVVKSNGISHDKVQAAPKVSGGEKQSVTDVSVVENFNEKQDVLGVKSTNCDVDQADEMEKTGAQNASFSTPKSGNVRSQKTVPQPFTLATEKRAAANNTANSNNSNSQVGSKNSQVINIFCSASTKCYL